MRLYAGSSGQFVEDTVLNQIAGKLKNAFFSHYRYNPPSAEVRSWQNSLRAMAGILQYGDLLDHGVMLEYQLPLTSRRLDFMVTGKGQANAGEEHLQSASFKRHERVLRPFHGQRNRAFLQKQDGFELIGNGLRGKGLFLMAEKRDAAGRDLFRQLADKIRK